MYNNNGGGFGGFGGFGGDMMGGAGGQQQSGGGYLGGFFPSPHKGDGGHISPTSGGMKRTEPAARDLQGLMAVTAKMVIEQANTQDGMDTGSSGILRFHQGHEASLLELVGQVESVDSDSGLLRYVVDDGTARVICKKYVDTDPMRSVVSITDNKKIDVRKWVRVIGPFRRYANEAFLTAHRIEEITNLDDIARHRIEVIHTFLNLTSAFNHGAATKEEHMNIGAVSSTSSVNFTSDHGMRPNNSESIVNTSYT